jgi:uncharacterized membrane protein
LRFLDRRPFSVVGVVIHLSELHGAATHLAVVAIPVYLLVLLGRWARFERPVLTTVQPWVEAAAVAGVLLAGVTGLLVWGQAKTGLRGSAYTLSSVHFWLGIVLSVVVVVSAGWQHYHRRQGRRHTYRAFVPAAVVAVIAVALQGYLGGRMTYHHAIGVFDGGQLAQSAAGAKQLDVALADGASQVVAGRQAFSANGLGCALCHGDHAQGLRGPRLAGGVGLVEFRRVHQHGLFPPSFVSDKDFAAIDAWLRTLPRGLGRRD